MAAARVFKSQIWGPLHGVAVSPDFIRVLFLIALPARSPTLARLEALRGPSASAWRCR